MCDFTYLPVTLKIASTNFHKLKFWEIERLKTNLWRLRKPK